MKRPSRRGARPPFSEGRSSRLATLGRGSGCRPRTIRVSWTTLLDTHESIGKAGMEQAPCCTFVRLFRCWRTIARYRIRSSADLIPAQTCDHAHGPARELETGYDLHRTDIGAVGGGDDGTGGCTSLHHLDAALERARRRLDRRVHGRD